MNPQEGELPRYVIMIHSWGGVGLFDTVLGQWVTESFGWRKDILKESQVFRLLQARGYPVAQLRDQLRLQYPEVKAA